MSTDSRDVGWRAVMTDTTAGQYSSLSWLNLKVNHQINWVHMCCLVCCSSSLPIYIMCYPIFVMIIHLSSLSGKNEMLILEQHCKPEDHEIIYKTFADINIDINIKDNKWERMNCEHTHKHPHINTRFESLKDNSLTYNVSFQHLISCKDEYFNHTDTEPTTKKHVKMKEWRKIQFALFF